jgi:antitoxin (DNA-binding transcriptional repressor) of toxin-antitoxin stability system
MIGLTVVGKPAATVMTSSPGRRRRSPSFGEVSADSATRFAEDPELTRTPWRRPKRLGKRFSNSAA